MNEEELKSFKWLDTEITAGGEFYKKDTFRVAKFSEDNPYHYIVVSTRGGGELGFIETRIPFGTFQTEPDTKGRPNHRVCKAPLLYEDSRDYEVSQLKQRPDYE